MPVRIAVVDPSGFKKTQMEVPENVSSSRLLEVLVPRMNLPRLDQAGREIIHRLALIRDGEEVQIGPEQSLSDAGVEDDDALRLYAEMRAGPPIAHPIADITNPLKILIPGTKAMTIYGTLSLEVTWKPTRFSARTAPGVIEVSKLLLSLQLLYEEALDSLGLPTQDLQVSSIVIPNASISLRGLGEAIAVLRDILEHAPDLVVSFLTIPALVKKKNLEIETDILQLEILRDALKERAKVRDDDAGRAFAEYLDYRMRDMPRVSTRCSVRVSSRAEENISVERNAEESAPSGLILPDSDH